MRKLTSYESFLYGVDAYDKEPIWLVNERRVYEWMWKLYRKMDRNWSGFNITKYVRFRIEHAPVSSYRKLPELSKTMTDMVNQFCSILQGIQQNVLSHYPPGRSVNLMGQEDRDYWDQAYEQLDELLRGEPDPERVREYKEYCRMKEEDQLLIAQSPKTREIRAAAHALPVGGKGEFVCPFCGGMADLEKPIETHWLIKCRQCTFFMDIWGW